jgi:hypothetical protein
VSYSCRFTQPATATQLDRKADHESYCLVADWLNSARLLNWVRDLQICINRVGICVVSKYGMALLAQTVNPESNLMAGLEINGGRWPMPIPGGVAMKMMSGAHNQLL